MSQLSAESPRNSVTTSDYDDYLRLEWKLFVENPRRAQISSEALSDRSLSSVLDVGCGAGQELLPFAARAVCIGVDLSPEVGRIGRELFSGFKHETRVAFVRAEAEALPFEASSFDAVICRLALPYTHNAQTLGEIARVLKPNGALLLKIHHARFYLKKLWTGLLMREFLSMVHAGRVLIAGLVYHLSGKQVRIRLLSPETFLTEWLLRRELERCGMSISAQLPDSNPDTPAFVICNNKVEP
jgi:ubiquinone/menaquinone biosynthesis C-methylase UbiE